MKILITGTSGYFGGLFLKKMIADKKITKIYALDVAKKPKDIDDTKIVWVRANLATDDWEKEILKDGAPEVVFHFAFWIRSRYGKIKEQERENLENCRRVANFCFDNDVTKLIYFSSAAAYGAKKENIGKLLNESDLLEEVKYPYGAQKRKAEDLMREIALRRRGQTQILIIRPASIWGPEAEKKKKIGLMNLLKKALPILPFANSFWARQYVYEQDLIKAVELLAFDKIEGNYEVFNLAAPDILATKDMARLLNKKTFFVPAFLIKIVFFFGWHLTRGIVPTPSGAEMSFTWPINMDGSKITELGFRYSMSSADIFCGKW